MPVTRRYIFILISILVHFIFLILDLSYYEEGGDTFIKNTLSGVFIGQPGLPPFSFGAHFGLSYFYLHLYKLFPHVMWYDFFTIFYSIVALTLVFFSFHVACKKKQLLPAIILGLTIYADNLLMFEITRISLTIAITSSFLLLSSPPTISNKKLILLQLLLCLSVFLRIESFFLGSFLMLLTVVINAAYVRNLKLLLPSLTVALLLSILLNVDWTPRDKQYNEIRPYQFILLDFETKQDGTFDSEEDSLTMEVAQLFFLNDEQRIDKDFFSKYLVLMDKNPLHLKNFITQTNFSKQAFENKLKRINFRYLLWWGLAAGFLAYLFYTKDTSKKLYVVFILYSFILLGIFVLMKMENRILLPASIGLLFLFLLAKPKPILIYSSILITGLFLSLPNAKYQELEQRFQTYAQLEKKQPQLEKYKFVVMDLHGSVWYGRKPFYKHQIQQKLICLDNAMLFMTPEYKDYMFELFGTSNTGDLMNILKDRPDVLFMGDVKRAKIINNYFNEVHGFNFKLHIFDKLDDLTSIYELK